MYIDMSYPFIHICMCICICVHINKILEIVRLGQTPSGCDSTILLQEVLNLFVQKPYQQKP